MVEVQDIFIEYGENYLNKHKLTLVQHKAMSAILKCRTSNLGGHVDVCDSCEILKFLITHAVTDTAQNAKLLLKNAGFIIKNPIYLT